ncbi:hypothetical protein GCK72_023095 [Caenorhabditis remanei]|uniref:Uncharacterized protein n=1 Tax=Caenorhabditis remanei TaxID=31234 RepID=A0A6A5FVJ6_CAERE|nr:hypothetical protein GCK72_023095 [Caenorhabditis remanei]KAF1746638.1 hypothetical protein GCK72_023095 [Caenorhabditis remanei]
MHSYIIFCYFTNAIVYGNSFITTRIPLQTADNGTIAEYFPRNCDNGGSVCDLLIVSHAMHYNFAYAQKESKFLHLWIMFIAMIAVDSFLTILTVSNMIIAVYNLEKQYKGILFFIPYANDVLIFHQPFLFVVSSTVSTSASPSPASLFAFDYQNDSTGGSSMNAVSN